MTRLTYTQTAFNAGEMSPRVGKRVDRDQIRRGLRDLKNFTVTPQGAIERRRGSRFVREVKTSANKTRLIPFIFSDIDSYAMEFGDGYIRFYRNFTIVTNGDVGAGGTASDPYEISTSYTVSDLFNIKFVQEGDIMYLTAGGSSVRPQKLSRLGTGQFTIEDFSHSNGAVLDVIEQSLTLTASAVSGTGITITASSTVFEAGHVGSLWELRNTSGTAASRGYFRITGFTSGTSVTADVVGDNLFGTSASSYWGEAAWSGVRGYPKAIAFHESRLAFAGTNEDPLTVWLSKSNANYEDFDYADANAADAMTITLSGQKNTIQWLVSDTNFLVAGTYGGVAFVGSGSATTALTPDNVQARNGEDYGSSSVQGLKFSNGIKYIQSAGKRLYQTEYDDISLKYKGFNLSSLHDEILDGGVSEMEAQTEPYEILWMVEDSGQLIGLLQEDEQQVLAYKRYITGTVESVCVVPNDGQGQLWLIVKRTIDGSDVRYVEYVEPNRELNYYVDCGVEYNGLQSIDLTLSATTGTGITVTAAGSLFSSSDVGRKIFTFDSSGAPVGRATITAFTSATVVTADVTADFASTAVSGWYLTATNITGLDHLEGESVQVAADGYFAGTYTVSSGEITLPDDKAAGLAYIGLSFNSDACPMPIEAGGRNGAAVSKLKRINRVGYSVYETQGFKSGRSFSDLRIIPTRKPASTMNAPVVNLGLTFMEDIVRSFSGRWERDPTVCIRQDLPAPLTLGALTYYMETHDS